MLEEKLPNIGLKASLHVELHVKTLKKPIQCHINGYANG